MIRIRIHGSPDRIEGFMIWGHAGFAPRDMDIVCAGVSAISTTAILGLTNLVPGSVRYGILPQGLIYCRVNGKRAGAGAREAQAVLAAAALGLQAIQDSYSAYIDFAYRR